MLDRFWKERIEDFDLRSKIGVGDTLGTDDIRPVLQQVAEMTEGLSGRSLMQLMNGAHPMQSTQAMFRGAENAQSNELSGLIDTACGCCAWT